MSNEIKIYTDGSCHTQYKVGGWAAILFYNNEKILLKGKIENTSHNRMELIAVIEAIKHAESIVSKAKLIVCSDSQYVVNIPNRMEKLQRNNYTTKKGISIRNVDLIKKLINQIQSSDIEFVKVKAHLKKSEIENPNREVDKISRKIVRDYINRNNAINTIK